MGILELDYRFNRKNWFETFSASLGTVVARQVRFSQNISKGREPELNIEKGLIAFGEKEVFQMQIIGKEDDQKGIWQWAFKDFANINSDYLELAHNVNALGVKFGNEALREPCFNLDELYNGHNLAAVACAMQSENYCYYRCSHPTGGLFVAIAGLPDFFFSPVNAERFVNYTLDCIEQVAVNQKVFVESFLSMNETPYDWVTPTRLFADFGEHHVLVDFKPGNGFLNIVQMRILDPNVSKLENSENSENAE